MGVNLVVEASKLTPESDVLDSNVGLKLPVKIPKSSIISAVVTLET